MTLEKYPDKTMLSSSSVSINENSLFRFFVHFDIYSSSSSPLALSFLNYLQKTFIYRLPLHLHRTMGKNLLKLLSLRMLIYHNIEKDICGNYQKFYNQ